RNIADREMLVHDLPISLSSIFLSLLPPETKERKFEGVVRTLPSARVHLTSSSVACFIPSNNMSDPSRSPNPLRKIAASLRALRERHQERHRPSGFDLALADRVDFFDRLRWD